jgi:electron transfer flavoprotein beta subunit
VGSENSSVGDVGIMGMNILVCVRAVPAAVTNLRIAENRDRIEFDAGSVTIDEPDEYAIEQALMLKRQLGGQITAVSLGPLHMQVALQRALARGADRAVRVDASGIYPEATSILLAEAIKRLNYDLILTGMESTDNMNAYIPVSLAVRLGHPFASGVTCVEPVEPGRIRLHKELGGGIKQILEMSLPALLSIQPGVFELSYIPVRRTLDARKHTIETLSQRDLNLTEEVLAQDRALKLVQLGPSAERTVRMIAGTPSEVAEILVRKIKEVA